jgi:glycerate kinase
MLTMTPSTAELRGAASGVEIVAKLAMQKSAMRPALPRLRTLKTFNLPPAQVEEVLLSAASMVPTPTSEILDNPLRILIAPSGFKESLGPEQVADAIDAGFRRVLDEKFVIMRKLPLHDGGEGFARALITAHGGDVLEKQVIGPVGDPVCSHLGFIGNDKKTAVLDMAAAAGLRLVPNSARDPTVTTTYGVGQLIKEALDAGSTKIIIGCGDSGTSDGGAGMLQALGVRLLDVNGHDLPRAAGGQSLTQLNQIVWDGIHPRLRSDVGK